MCPMSKHGQVTLTTPDPVWGIFPPKQRGESSATAWRTEVPPRGGAWENVWTAGTYWALGVLVKEYFSRYQMWPAPLWPPAGISMFAGLTMGRRSWPGLFVGSLLTNMYAFGQPLLWAAIISCGNTLAPIVAVDVVGRRISRGEEFSRLADGVYFCGCTLLHGTLSATFGMCAVWAKGALILRRIPDSWMDWMLSDAAASLPLTPLLLLWRQPVRHKLSRLGLREFAASATGSVAALAYLLFATSGEHAAGTGASFLVLLPLLWMSLRLTLAMAYSMFATTIGAIMIGTLLGHGPFAQVEAGRAFILFAQMTIGFGASVLLLGVASNEQRTASQSVQKLNDELEARVEQRTAQPQESQHRLEKAAFYDPLTGLPNRRLLEERFRFCAASARRRREQVGLLLLDLDHFKEINDNLGHDAGDALLVETGHRIEASVRECDMVARIGGDEFVVLLPQTGHSIVTGPHSCGSGQTHDLRWCGDTNERQYRHLPIPRTRFNLANGVQSRRSGTL